MGLTAVSHITDIQSGPGACGCPEPLFERIVGKVEKPALTQQLGYPLALTPPDAFASAVRGASLRSPRCSSSTHGPLN